MQIGGKRNKFKKPAKKVLTIKGRSDIMGTLSRKAGEGSTTDVDKQKKVQKTRKKHLTNGIGCAILIESPRKRRRRETVLEN